MIKQLDSLFKKTTEILSILLGIIYFYVHPLFSSKW